MSRIRVESPTPVNQPITTTIQPLTRTPSKRRRERGLSNVLQNPDSTNSAVTKKVTTPRRPTVSCRLSLKQVEAAQKQEWEAEWYEWVVGHLWAKDKSPNYKHPPGTITMYRRNGLFPSPLNSNPNLISSQSSIFKILNWSIGELTLIGHQQ